MSDNGDTTHRVNVDHRLLDQDVLLRVLKEIVLRSGTDYGDVEMPISVKVEQLLSQLETGKGLLMVSLEDGYCDVLPS